MKTASTVVLCLCCGVLVGGCATVQTLERKAAFSVGATELDMDKIDTGWEHKAERLEKADIGATPDRKMYLGYVAVRSEQLCREFLSGLAVSANGTNSGLDMLTTVFSALATAFTPISTIHTLTAGATIAGGWKSAIDSDVYSKMGVQNIVQAIKTTYFKDITGYVQSLNSVNNNDLVVTVELAKIENIHAECTLASAEGYITSALSPVATAASTASTTLTSITVSTANKSGAAKADTLTLSGKSAKVGNIPDVTIAITAGESANEIRDGILSAIESQISAKAQPDITASISNGAVVIQAPFADEILWTPVFKGGTSSGVKLTVEQNVGTGQVAPAAAPPAAAPPAAAPPAAAPPAAAPPAAAPPAAAPPAAAQPAAAPPAVAPPAAAPPATAPLRQSG